MNSRKEKDVVDAFKSIELTNDAKEKMFNEIISSKRIKNNTEKKREHRRGINPFLPALAVCAGLCIVVGSVLLQGDKKKEISLKANIEVSEVWNVDLTNDGKDEKILVNTNKNTITDQNAIEIYDGETGKIIWVHKMNDKVYESYSIIKYEEKYSLFECYSEKTEDTLQTKYEIFNLNKDGTENKLNEKIVNVEKASISQNKIEELMQFYREIDNYSNQTEYLLARKDTDGYYDFSTEASKSKEYVYGISQWNLAEMAISLYNNGCEESKQVPAHTEKYENMKEINDSVNSDSIEWSADLTHNGTMDRIEVKLPHKEISEDSLDEMSIEVYSGISGNLLWNMNMIIEDFPGKQICLYSKDGLDYLLIYEKNYSSEEMGVEYKYSLINFNENGEINVLEDKEIFSSLLYMGTNIEATSDEMNQEIGKLAPFIAELNNEYFAKSIILAGNLNGWGYSTPEKKVICNENIIYETRNLYDSMMFSMQ